jgi:hypothetical protein
MVGREGRAAVSNKPYTLDELQAALEPHIDRALHRGEPMFMGKPDRWYEDAHWRCLNHHVSTMLLKTQRGSVCLECGEPAVLTFPDDRDGRL